MGEKSYENPRIKTEPGKESQGTKASTVTMMDLSQPFLVEYILERATLVNKRLEEMKQQKNTETQVQSQNVKHENTQQSSILSCKRYKQMD